MRGRRDGIVAMRSEAAAIGGVVGGQDQAFELRRLEVMNLADLRDHAPDDSRLDLLGQRLIAHRAVSATLEVHVAHHLRGPGRRLREYTAELALRAIVVGTEPFPEFRLEDVRQHQHRSRQRLDRAVQRQQPP